MMTVPTPDPHYHYTTGEGWGDDCTDPTCRYEHECWYATDYDECPECGSRIDDDDEVPY